MQRYCLSLAFKHLTLLPSTSYLLPLHPSNCLMFLAVFLHLQLSLPPSLTRSALFNGMLEVSVPGALNYYTLFCLILLTFICIQESNLNSTSSFWSPAFSTVRSDRIHSRWGILSPDYLHASGNVIIFVKQSLSFSGLSISSLSLLGPYSDYVRVNISLNNFSPLSFLNVYAPSIRSFSTDSRTDYFSPPFFPPPNIS